MWSLEEMVREWSPLAGALVLLVLLFFGSRIRRTLGSRPSAAAKPVEDLEAVTREWRQDVCVFDQPGEFGYRIYTDRYDQVVHAADLPPNSGAEQHRELLDRHVRLNAEATNRLAALLAERGVNKTTCAAILIDHSGSLKRQIGAKPDQHPTDGPVVGEDSAAAVAAGIAASIALALEACSASTELLGFTTRRWRGGQSRRDWIEAGRPPYPGRLNDLLHIIYKQADEPSVSDCCDRLAAMLDPANLKENVDGEAIAWARSRLLADSSSDRLLIVLSDGASIDDSTLYENGRLYLERHLVHAINDIERRKDLRLVGIGIGFQVSRYYANSESLGTKEWSYANRIDAIADLISGSRPAEDAQPGQ